VLPADSCSLRRFITRRLHTAPNAGRDTCGNALFCDVVLEHFLRQKMKSIFWGALIFLLWTAIPAYTQVLLLDRVYEHIRKNELESARSAIDIAVTHETTVNDPRSWYYKGFVYKDLFKLNPSANSAYRETALNAFRKSMQLDTRKRYLSECTQGINYLLTTYYNEGVEFFNQKQYEKAIASFQHYITHRKSDKPDEQFKEAVSQIGYAYFIAGNLPEARRYYEQAIQLNYANPYVYDDLATIYLQTRNEELAARIIETGRAKFPENPGLRVTEINWLLTRGEYGRAEKLAEEYLQLEPGNIEVMLVAGTIYGKIPAADKAAKDQYFAKRKAMYQRVLAIDPGHFAANLNLGVTLYNRAVDLINDQTQQYDIDIVAFHELLTTCTELFKEALPYVTKANSLSPANVTTLKALEGIYYNLNEREKSLAIREQIKSLH
jgi:tetratricopeptide (TPR) repeat protein